MRIIVHDFSGHPFQAELARALGRRDHDVLHVRCVSYVGGKGAFPPESGGSVQYAPLSVGAVFERYRTLPRLAQELAYARKFNALAAAYRPDVVVSCNDPLLAKAGFAQWARRHQVPWVFWLQDVYSVAMAREAARRSPAGRVVGAGFQRLERRLLGMSDEVVAITDDFGPILDQWAVPARKRTVIENWAPLDEVPQRPRDNRWRADMGLGDRFVYLYAGTLGLKHNPGLLYELAEAEPDADVVVVSEGLGAERLRAMLDDRPLGNLKVLPFQPWEQAPDMLGAADVLVVLLEAEAGTYSVPSKILTSLCAGRPILAAMPAANLGARTIVAAGAGCVVPAEKSDEFLREAHRLRHDDGARRAMGAAGRAYAERAFDIEDIADRFMVVIERARRARSPRRVHA